MENGDGRLSLENDKEKAVLHAPPREELLETVQASGFTVTVSRALKLREINVAHGLWKEMDTTENGALAKESGPTWANSSPEEGLHDNDKKMGTMRRLRLRIQNEGRCARAG